MKSNFERDPVKFDEHIAYTETYHKRKTNSHGVKTKSRGYILYLRTSVNISRIWLSYRNQTYDVERL